MAAWLRHVRRRRYTWWIGWDHSTSRFAPVRGMLEPTDNFKKVQLL